MLSIPIIQWGQSPELTKDLLNVIAENEDWRHTFFSGSAGTLPRTTTARLVMYKLFEKREMRYMRILEQLGFVKQVEERGDGSVLWEDGDQWKVQRKECAVYRRILDLKKLYEECQKDHKVHESAKRWKDIPNRDTRAVLKTRFQHFMRVHRLVHSPTTDPGPLPPIAIPLPTQHTAGSSNGRVDAGDDRKARRTAKKARRAEPEHQKVADSEDEDFVVSDDEPGYTDAKADEVEAGDKESSQEDGSEDEDEEDEQVEEQVDEEMEEVENWVPDRPVKKVKKSKNRIPDTPPRSPSLSPYPSTPDDEFASIQWLSPPPDADPPRHLKQEFESTPRRLPSIVTSDRSDSPPATPALKSARPGTVARPISPESTEQRSSSKRKRDSIAVSQPIPDSSVSPRSRGRSLSFTVSIKDEKMLGDDALESGDDSPAGSPSPSDHTSMEQSQTPRSGACHGPKSPGDRILCEHMNKYDQTFSRLASQTILKRLALARETHTKAIKATRAEHVLLDEHRRTLLTSTASMEFAQTQNHIAALFISVYTTPTAISIMKRDQLFAPFVRQYSVLLDEQTRQSAAYCMYRLTQDFLLACGQSCPSERVMVKHKKKTKKTKKRNNSYLGPLLINAKSNGAILKSSQVHTHIGILKCSLVGFWRWVDKIVAGRPGMLAEIKAAEKGTIEPMTGEVQRSISVVTITSSPESATPIEACKAGDRTLCLGFDGTPEFSLPSGVADSVLLQHARRDLSHMGGEHPFNSTYIVYLKHRRNAKHRQNQASVNERIFNQICLYIHILNHQHILEKLRALIIERSFARQVYTCEIGGKQPFSPLFKYTKRFLQRLRIYNGSLNSVNQVTGDDVLVICGGVSGCTVPQDFGGTSGKVLCSLMDFWRSLESWLAAKP